LVVSSDKIGKDKIAKNKEKLKKLYKKILSLRFAGYKIKLIHINISIQKKK